MAFSGSLCLHVGADVQIEHVLSSYFHPFLLTTDWTGQDLYSQALSVHPSHAGILADLARFHYLMLDNKDEARQLLKLAFTLHPQSASGICHAS